MSSKREKKELSSNRRRAPRANVKIPVEIKIEKNALEGRTNNISASGVYCTVDRFIPINTKLDVTLLVPEKARREREKSKEMKCHGIVVRNQPVGRDEAHRQYGLALYFTDITRDDQAELSNYVYARLPRKEQQMFAKEKLHPRVYKPGEVFSRTDIGDSGFSVSSANFRVLGEEINLSKNGIVCQTDRHIPLFREIAVNLVLPPRKARKADEKEALQCSAVVVGCTKVPNSSKYDMAAYFVGLSPEQKKRLEECIEKIL
ncbi:MAG: PilZ domain-containing protein [Candidatus Aureabacteria bacterium]|nr:PilZ domain-containing protein [Candidatus Auribacterota bacterium]